MKRFDLYTATIILALCFFLFCITNPSLCAHYIRESLFICYQSLIPSLFPCIIVSTFLGRICNFKSNGFTRLFSRLFGLCPLLSFISFLGLFFGFPSGACAVSQAYMQKKCSKQQAEFAIAISNNPSCAFLTGVVGITLFASAKIGLLLVISQILSVFTVSFLLKKIYNLTFVNSYKFQKHTSDKPTNASLIKALVYSIKDSALSLLFICAFTVFFYLVSSVTSSFLPIFNSGLLKSILCGFLEITSGAFSCSDLPFPQSIVVCSSLCSFGGLSVYFQVLSICESAGLSAKLFLVSRFLCAPISALYTLILLLLVSYFPFETIAISISFFTACVILFHFLQKKIVYWVEIHKNKP